MKKPLLQTLALLSVGACLHAQIFPAEYGGPVDETYWTGVPAYDSLFSWTTLGKLARRSDVIGVGQVSNRQGDHFTVTVSHALVGCTNGASIMMMVANPFGLE